MIGWVNRPEQDSRDLFYDTTGGDTSNAKMGRRITFSGAGLTWETAARHALTAEPPCSP